MVLPNHLCPYGLRAKQLLDDAGVTFEDRLLTSRDEVDAFLDEHGVDTTPQLFVDGKRIGGSDAVAEWLETVTA
jgi:glutaredoxin